jgi:hypothetical protein
VTDPELLAKVQTGATSFWKSASSTAGTWWSSAQKFAVDALAEPPAASVGHELAPAASPTATEKISTRATDKRLSAPVASVDSLPEQRLVVGSKPVEDDDAWLASQMAAVTKSDRSLQNVASKSMSTGAGAAAKKDAWDVDDWDLGDTVKPSAPTATARPSKESDELPAAASGTSIVSAAPSKSVETKSEDDDFFASFGLT